MSMVPQFVQITPDLLTAPRRILTGSPISLKRKLMPAREQIPIPDAVRQEEDSVGVSIR